MRIGGLATGMDTEAIIRDMMEMQRQPLHKVNAQKQFLEWQLDDYRSVNRDLNKFSQNLFDNMILTKSFTAKKVSISDPNAVSIKSSSSTRDFSGSIEIKQLASNANFQSAKLENVNLTTKMSDLEINGEETLSFTVPDGKGYPETKEITIKADDTLEKVLSKLGEKGINAFYDDHTGQIAMTAKNSGAGEITFSGDSTVLSGLGLTDGATSNEGQNAKFIFNGLETERASNTFEISGFEITLKNAEPGKEITFNSTADTDKIVESVTAFVDEYNELIEELNGKLRETKYRDYNALTEDQKNEMKEKEIEQWEEKAMSGTLRNDPTISSMLSQMRTAMFGSVDVGGGEKMSLSDIGITTTKNYLDNGKLTIDEDKLRDAINADPSKVQRLFGQDEDENNDNNTIGIARQLRTVVDNTQKSISNKAGKSSSTPQSFTLGRNLIEMDKQIERFERRLQMSEDRLWKQFSAMESAIQKANAQADQLMNALGGMGMF